jgi:hypothetical protein
MQNERLDRIIRDTFGDRKFHALWIPRRHFRSDGKSRQA